MKYIALILLIATLSACNDPNYPDERLELKQGEMDYTLFTIDSCEYIWYKFRGTFGQTMTHKGNCKNHKTN